MSILCWKVTTEASSGLSGMKTAPKYWSLTPAKSKGPLRVAPPEIFLKERCSTLPLALVSTWAPA